MTKKRRWHPYAGMYPCLLLDGYLKAVLVWDPDVTMETIQDDLFHTWGFKDLVKVNFGTAPEIMDFVRQMRQQGPTVLDLTGTSTATQRAFADIERDSLVINA